MLKLLLPLLALASTPDTFRARLSEDLGTLDWNYGEVNQEIVLQLMEGLYTTDPQGQAKAALVKSQRWEGKQTLELTLKKTFWSDGERVCAKHFVDSFQRLQDKKFASPYAHYANVLAGYEAESCEKLKLRFTRPTPEAPALLAHPVFFPVRLDQIDNNPKLWNEGFGLAVTGPFLVESWDKNQKIRLARNARYHGKKTSLKHVEFLFLPEENTAKILFDKGELDWVKDVGPLLRTPELEKSAAFRVFPTLITYYFGLNAGKAKLLEDPLIRRALSDALDRRELTKVLGMEARGVETWLTPEIFPSLRLRARERVSFELAAGKLKTALKSGAMDLKLRTYSKTTHKLLAEWAQGQWEKKLGVRIPIEVQEGKIYWKEIGVNPPPIYFSGVTAPYGHPRAFLQEFLSSSTANWTGWSDKNYDAAVENNDAQKAEDILGEAGFIIPVYSRGTVALVKPRWKGFHINPLGQVFLRGLR